MKTKIAHKKTPSKKKPKSKKATTAWDRVQLARHAQRPFMMDYIPRIFHEFVEVHGDRAFGDDPAMVTGFALLEGLPVAVVGQQKGHDTKENIRRNFGMSQPEGYRKALRVMKLAEKFHKPIITFIDTAGAYPGLGGEERGQAEAIARNLLEMAKLKTPIISIILGEGGSGGAIGIGVANKVLMMENAWYSVISPEGCAAILWNDREKIQQASEVLRLSAPDLMRFKVIDEIIPEPVGGAQLDHEKTSATLKTAILKHLRPLLKLSPKALEEQRYKKFRAMGQIKEK